MTGDYVTYGFSGSLGEIPPGPPDRSRLTFEGMSYTPLTLLTLRRIIF